MVDTSVTPGLGLMELVAQRDAATLLPIIQQHVHPGTTVWSDMWATYSHVQHIPPVAQHQTVSHSIEFVNSATGVPYPTHKIALEQSQNKNQENERLP